QLKDKNLTVVVTEIATITAETGNELQRIRQKSGVGNIALLYKFASMDQAETFSDAHTALIARRPFNYREFARTLAAVSRTDNLLRHSLSLPPHRFSRKLLTNLAVMSPVLACECPRHTAEIIMELSDFEKYSADCEQTKPADAAIHNMLRRTAAMSRALFEDALIALAEEEDIDLDEAQQG
ncbi:MAG: hypothetical protein AAF438_08995, partial [Pseudomonadota bacterium]